MYHSVTFGSKNSFTDWHLVPDSRPVVVMPETKTTTVDVPGSNGLLDLSETLTKYPLYSNRSGSFRFHVLNDMEPWQVIYHNIVNYLHGHRRQMVLEDDPNYYYEGRYKVAWTSNNDGTWSDVDIEYNLDPFKYYYQTSVQEDPNLYKGITLSGSSKLIKLANEPTIGTVPVVPEFIVSNISNGGVSLSFINSELGISKSVSFTSNQTAKYYDIIFSNLSGGNVCNLTFSGYGKVNIVFRRMSL